MSKIMRLMYAEARAAREAVATPSPPNTAIEWWTLPVPNPVESARSTLEWWAVGIANSGQQGDAAAGRRPRRVAFAAG